MAGPTDTEELNELHLAELHARAAAAGVEGYRLLRREALIEKLGGVPASAPAPSRGRRRRAPDVDPERDTDEVEAVADAEPVAETPADDGEETPRPRRRRGRRGGRGRGGGEREKLAPEAGQREADGGSERRDDSDAETEQVTGTLELTRQRHGFLRVPGSDEDVYVSASQVRRCELKAGDEVTGPARAPRRGERHRALVRVELVNGAEPVDLPAGAAPGRAGRPADAEPEATAPDGPDFDSFTAASPARRITLPDAADTLPRAVDLLAPLAFGQRVLVRSAPRSGRTALLRALASTLAATEGVDLTVLLIDERPEEVAAWSETVAAESLALASADISPGEQVKVATTALDRARAKAAAGGDTVLLCDSLTRLAVAADGVAEVKRLFGSGRELAEEGAGSLTVIATALDEGDDDGSAERAVATTETSLVTLDPSLAEEGIVPALRFGECRIVGEEHLLSEEECDGLRHLRVKLAELVPPEAATFIRELLAEHPTNAEALKSLA